MSTSAQFMEARRKAAQFFGLRSLAPLLSLAQGLVERRNGGCADVNAAERRLAEALANPDLAAVMRETMDVLLSARRGLAGPAAVAAAKRKLNDALARAN